MDLDMRDQVATRDARDDGPNPRGGRQQTLGRHRTNPIARFSPGGGAFGWLICRQESCVVPSRRPPQAGIARQTDMEWQEALLMAWDEEIPSHPAAYYRRQAARARRVAEGATTRAVKARLLDDADHYDELAAKADGAGADAEKP